MIPLFKVHDPKTLGPLVDKLFKGGMVTEGEYSDKFESMFSEFVENSNCSLVNSCTSALTLAYKLCDIRPGDEVIVTPMTCMATNEPLDIFGAKLVFADIDPRTGNIDPEDVRRKITNKTKAISSVHWAGQPFDIDSIGEIARKNGIKVVEDAAHALGATYNGRAIGGHSDYVCFSFQAIKHLTTADGGAITSRIREDDQRIKKLRWFGLDRKYTAKTGRSRWEQDVEECGYKFHMNNLNALIGIEQMKHIDNIVKAHKDNSRFYDENLNNRKITKLYRDPKSESSCWIYSILVEDREDFKSYLQSNGIASDVVHVRNDKYSVYKEFAGKEPLKGCDEFCSKMTNIPVGWWLTEEDRVKIVNVVNAY
jgi:perosamine synthetase